MNLSQHATAHAFAGEMEAHVQICEDWFNLPSTHKTPSGGWYSSVYTLWEQRSTFKHHHTLNINQNYFVIAETYQNCK